MVDMVASVVAEAKSPVTMTSLMMCAVGGKKDIKV